ncbi:MAG: Uncharacterized protein G01um10143_138 [Parcubacteria group bacterium Gr01-1014_3]|nr:MAG: Uncharacterized protein G01um10143_138 [Parcubacteria group bacterium Gr01-1014_3]
MEIRHIKKSEWGKLRAFNEAEYPPGHILTDKIYYDWQFGSPFHSDSSTYSTLGAFNETGDLVGIIAFFEVPCKLPENTASGIWMANLMVKSDFRSLGLGYLLLEKASSFGDIIIDYDINQTAWPLFMKSGWKGMNVKRYLIVLKSDQTSQVAGVSINGSSLGTGMGGSAGYDIEVIDRFENEMDQFWSRIKSRYPITIERSSLYMNWRYADCPLVNYHILYAKKNNEIVACAIIRIDEIVEGAERSPIGVRVGRIIDLFGLAEADEEILRAVIDFCKEQNVAFIDFFYTGRFYDKALSAVGFVDSDQPPYASIPTLLNPIDRIKRTKNNFAFRLMNQNFKDSRIDDLDNWFSTKGNGDQDRPY